MTPRATRDVRQTPASLRNRAPARSRTEPRSARSSDGRLAPGVSSARTARPAQRAARSRVGPADGPSLPDARQERSARRWSTFVWRWRPPTCTPSPGPLQAFGSARGSGGTEAAEHPEDSGTSEAPFSAARSPPCQAVRPATRRWRVKEVRIFPINCGWARPFPRTGCAPRARASIRGSRGQANLGRPDDDATTRRSKTKAPAAPRHGDTGLTEKRGVSSTDCHPLTAPRLRGGRSEGRTGSQAAQRRRPLLADPVRPSLLSTAEPGDSGRLS